MKSIDEQVHATRIKLEALLAQYLDSRHIKSFLREGGKIVLREMKNRVPVDTGRLKESLAILNFRGQNNAIYIGARYHSRRNSDGDEVSKTGRHAHLVEFGFINRAGQRQEGHPFVKPTFIATKTAAETAVLLAIEKFQKKWETKNEVRP